MPAYPSSRGVPTKHTTGCLCEACETAAGTWESVDFTCAPDCQERTNCPEIGGLGHYLCGVCQDHQGPRHHCGCLVAEPRARTAEDMRQTPLQTEATDLLALTADYHVEHPLRQSAARLITRLALAEGKIATAAEALAEGIDQLPRETEPPALFKALSILRR